VLLVGAFPWPVPPVTDGTLGAGGADVKMAGKVPVKDMSRKVVPSLVVAAAKVVMATCSKAGSVNASKLKAIVWPEAKLPPAVITNTTFKTWPIMVGVHVAPDAGAVTVHVLVPIVKDPASVMRMAEVAADVMAVAGVNVTVAVVTALVTWEPRVTAGPVMEPHTAGATSANTNAKLASV